MKKVVIVMAAWNEAENIKKMIDTLFEEVFPKINADMHLLISDNHSTDGMTQIVESEMKRRKNLHIIPPEFVKPMVEAYLDGAEYVIGSRYIPGGSIPKEWAFFRKFISYFGNLFARVVLTKFSIHDMTTGFRLTKVKGVLDQIDLDNLMEKERFAYKLDLLYQSTKNSKKTVEVPLEFRPRTTDKSKFNVKEMIASYKTVVILGIKDKKRFIKFGTVGFIGYLVNAVGLAIFGKTSLPEWLIWTFATEFAIISNFTLNNLWTFKAEKISGVAQLIKKFLQFNGTSGGALVIQAVFGSIGVALFGTDSRQILLPFIIVFLVLPYNYFMYNVIIWKTWSFSKVKSKLKSLFS